MLPTTQDYKISLMIGQDSFRTLENVEVIPNPNYPDEPWYATGGLAIVFKLKLKDKLYALKCFYNEANERQERLELVTAYLKEHPSPYFVDFTYLENELWVATDYDEGQGYPVVLMEWVEGKTLDNYLEQLCTQQNIPALRNLYFQFCNLAWWLQQQPIAHGDIKHDNLIVTPDGKLKLIDYDGVFVPAMRGRKANEMGSPCYQHPKRDAYFFDKNLDDFSLLVLQITLLALQHQPKLFEEHYNGDGIILKDTDYQNFAQSIIKTILWQLPEVKIPLLLSQLQANLTNLSSIDLMPLLQDVAWINWLIGGQKDDKLEFERQKFKELVLGDERWRELFIVQVSKNYLLTETMILKYSNRWNWTRFGWRTDLPISSDLLFVFRCKLDWKSIEHFIERNSINWSIEFLDIFVSDLKWDQWGLSSSSKIEWSEELIEKFKNKWEWGGYENGINPRYTTGGSILGLSSNEAIPWSIELIEKYEDKWSWDHLSSNEALPWSSNLIENFKDKWNWGVSLTRGLSGNNAVPWSIELIERYQDKWSWGHLSSNKSLPWSIILVEHFKDKWDWDEVSSKHNISFLFDDINSYSDKLNWDSLSKNQNAFWTQQIIKNYEDKWNWEYLSANKSLPWSVELIKMYEHKWNWEYLSNNKSLSWSFDLIKMYEERWNMKSLWINLTKQENYDWSLDIFQILVKKNSETDNKNIEDGWKNLSKVNNFPWSVELIVRYKYEWDFFQLSCNKSISFSLIELTINHGIHGNYYWNWEQLSHGQKVPWSIPIIEKYANYWSWRCLSSNPYLPWSIELVNKYKEKWDYDSLSLNAGIPWSEELIRTYEDTLNWTHLSRNEALPWTLELIEQYRDKWSWYELSAIEAIPWDMKLFLKYENNWDLRRLKYNITFYENIFIPILNDEFIDEVMAEM